VKGKQVAFTDVMRMMNSPLMASNKQSDFFALVLAECALYGVPAEAIALFRDIHAMVGYSKPLGEKQVAALAGDLVSWHDSPNQKKFDRVHDVERLAYHQRALIAFGGGRPDEMVGRAEIVNALGNLIGTTKWPAEYTDIFRWASLDTLSIIQGYSRAEVLAAKAKQGWTDISDEDVVKPGGRLYPTYQKICTQIRRESIAAMEREPINHPRSFLRPWAAQFLQMNQKVRAEAAQENLTDVVALVDEHIANIHTMFPDLGSFDEELDRRKGVVNKMLSDA
jgi:hypothetical protein